MWYGCSSVETSSSFLPSLNLKARSFEVAHLGWFAAGLLLGFMDKLDAGRGVALLDLIAVGEILRIP